MDVLFISDFNLEHNSGGAQVSNDAIIRAGRERGLSITEFNHDTSSLKLMYRYDLLISSNLEVLSHRSDYIFDRIINHPNHIRLEHDSCSYLPADKRRKLFSSTKKNFFLSQFHLDFFKEAYGDYFENVEINFDPIDTKIFYPSSNKKRKYDIVYCGFLHELKGAYNLIHTAVFNPQRKFDVFGWSDNERLIKELQQYPNIELHQPVPLNEVGEIYRNAKFIFHDPVVNEPFCRMVGEALICGCELMGNGDKIGSYQEFYKLGSDEFRAQTEKAQHTFWDKIL